MVKSYNKCYISVFFFFFRFGQTLFNLAHMSTVHHEKGSVHIDHLFDDLESGKRNYWFGKKCGKSLEVWIQKSARTLCYVVRETCKVLFRNQMNWTISVWADFNISVNFYPLVPFISIFFPSIAASYLTSTIWKASGNLCANPPPPIFIPN